MTFLWPYLLLTLLLAPLLLLLYVKGQRRRERMLAAYGTMGVVQTAAGRSLGWRRHIPYALYFCGFVFMALALARPQAEVTLPRLEGVVILAFDVSGSMAATDLEPTRMDAARAAAIEFVQRQPSTVLVGVVAFSESGLTIQPPTSDQAAVLATINRLRPERGTSLATGILASLNTLFATPEPSGAVYSNLTPTPAPSPTPAPPGSYDSVAVVLLTDGENTAPPEPFDAAQIAADRGVRIYPIGIGSAAGANIEIDGLTYHTMLDEATLKEIARLTEGDYFNAQDEEELTLVYERLNLQLASRPERTEVTALFAGVAMLFLLGGGVLSMFLLGRVP